MRELTNIDPNEIYVYAATSDKFAETAKAYMGLWYECLESRVDGYDLGQIVIYKKVFWFGAFLWRRAQCQSYPRDRFLGWHACQQAERLPLVIECLGFQPMHHAPDQPNYGCIALNAARLSLQPDWVDYFGYVPLLMDTHLKASSGFASYFKEAGWTRTTDKNPRAAASHWVKELVPDARAIITAKHLDKAYSGVASPYVDGLLPIQDELLFSFRNSFNDLYDPRKNNSHYPLDTLLAIAFLSLISGSTSINGIVKFSKKRLSCKQAQLLGLPFSKDGSTFDIPKYHSYYRLLWRLDIMQLAPLFINWLNAHMAQLPGVLHPDGDIVRDTLFAFNRFRAPPSTWAIKLDYETPVGIDPDAPDGFKRDADGNLIE